MMNQTGSLETIKTHSDLEASFARSDCAIHRSGLKWRERTSAERKRHAPSAIFKGFWPILEWLPKYGRDCRYHRGCGNQLAGIHRDVLAGVVIGIMLVPQGMASAMLAGLPPVYGLYSGTWTLIAYMVFGTCKFLGPGVNAPISLLSVDALSNVLKLQTDCGDDTSSQDCADFINASMTLCLMVGVLYLIMAVSRLSVVTALMPEPSLSGFTTGAAIIIISSNIKLFIGVAIPRSSVITTWIDVFKSYRDVNPTALIIGILSFLMLRCIQEVNRNPKVKAKLPIPIPEQLVVLIISTVVVWFCRLDAAPFNVPIVGEIPAGLYAPRCPELSLDLLSTLMQPAFSVAFVTYILTINVAKAMASKHSINVDGNQELVALAAQSIVGGLTGSCVPSGSFSRTALIALMEAESPLHNLVSCIVVGLVSLAMTGLLYCLPKAVLASIIFVALRSMMNFSRGRELFSVSKVEFSQWFVAFMCTAFAGVTYGIFASISLSVLLLLKQASKPTTAVLAELPGTGIFVPKKFYPQAQEVAGVKVFRFDGPFTFANKDCFEEKLRKMEIQDASSVPVHTIVLDCSAVSSIDTSAGGLLQRLVNEYAKAGVRVFFANWRGLDYSGESVLQALSFTKTLPMKFFFFSIADAVAVAVQSQDPQPDGQSEKNKNEALTTEQVLVSESDTVSDLGLEHSSLEPWHNGIMKPCHGSYLAE